MSLNVSISTDSIGSDLMGSHCGCSMFYHHQEMQMDAQVNLLFYDSILMVIRHRLLLIHANSDAVVCGVSSQTRITRFPVSVVLHSLDAAGLWRCCCHNVRTASHADSPLQPIIDHVNQQVYLSPLLLAQYLFSCHRVSAEPRAKCCICRLKTVWRKVWTATRFSARVQWHLCLEPLTLNF